MWLRVDWGRVVSIWKAYRVRREKRPMPYRGHIKNGVVAPDQPFPWPDGTEVVVEAVEPAPRTTLVERFRDVIGSVTDLPPDMARNHDHYVHGTPKQ